MDANTFMGYFIGAVLALLGGTSIIVAIAIKPILDLNKQITVLQDSIKSLNSQDKEIKADYTELKDEVRDIKEKVNVMDKRFIKIETELDMKGSRRQ